MSAKMFSFRIEEKELTDLKNVASVYSISITELIKNAVNQYVLELKRDPFYRLTENIKDADEAETKEILEKIEGMSDDDLSIAATKHFSV